MKTRKLAAQLCLAAIADGASAYALAQVDVPTRAAQAFKVVRSVLQHPRCANCHIPEDALASTTPASLTR